MRDYQDAMETHLAHENVILGDMYGKRKLLSENCSPMSIHDLGPDFTEILNQALFREKRHDAFVPHRRMFNC